VADKGVQHYGRWFKQTSARSYEWSQADCRFCTDATWLLLRLRQRNEASCPFVHSAQCTVHMLRLFTRDQLQSDFCSQQRSEIDEAIISFRVTALRGSVHWPAELSIPLPPAVADVAVGFHKIPRIAARLGLELARSARSMGGPPSIEQRSDQGSHTGRIRPASTW
jgi:hypothetical protein